MFLLIIHPSARHSDKGDDYRAGGAYLMEYLGKVLFAAAAIILAIGVFTNLSQDGSIAGTGTMAMNTYYLLGMTLFTSSAAAEIIWNRR